MKPEQERMFRLLGDIHGAVLPLQQAMQHIDYPLIQLGDFGWGKILYVAKKYVGKVYFLGGNHEWRKLPTDHPCWLGDYGPLRENNNVHNDIFFMRGAQSVDRVDQILHNEYCEEEELSYTQLDQAYHQYMELKPRIVLSHTCPAHIASRLISGEYGDYKMSRTDDVMQTMWEDHKPEYWFFGHWHRTYKVREKGTNFRCLNTNEYVDICI